MAEVKIVGIIVIAPGTVFNEMRIDVAVSLESKMTNIFLRVIYKDQLHWLQGSDKQMNGRYIFHIL